MATPDQAIEEVRRLRELAQEKADSTPEARVSVVEKVLTFGFSSSEETDAQAAVRNSLSIADGLIEKWEGDHLRWANAGQRDDGSAYSFDRWFAEGKVIASDLSAQAEDAVDGSAFLADVHATEQTVSDAEDLAANAAQGVGGALLSRKFWWAVGVGGALLGAAYIWPIVRPFIKRAKA